MTRIWSPRLTPNCPASPSPRITLYCPASSEDCCTLTRYGVSGSFCAGSIPNMTPTATLRALCRTTSPVLSGAMRLTPCNFSPLAGNCSGLIEPFCAVMTACGISPRMLFCSSRSKPFMTDSTVTSAITPSVMPMVDSQETKRPKRSAVRPRI